MPAAALQAAATVGSSLIQSGSANKASKGQQEAAERVAQMQFDLLNKSAGYLDPYRNFGGGALPGLAGLLGYGQFPGATGSMGYAGTGGSAPDWKTYLQQNPDVLAEYNKILPTVDWNSPWAREHGFQQGAGPEPFAEWHYNTYGKGENRALPMSPSTGGGGGSPSSASMQAFLESIPGYQFAKQQGTQAALNSGIAKGYGGTSGPLAKGIARFVTGLADQTYGSQIERLMNAAKMGQGAATDSAKLTADAGSNAGNAILAGAGARAGGILGSGSALSGGLYSLANNGDLTSGIAKFLGRSFGGGGGGWAGDPSGAAAAWDGSIPKVF